MPGLNLEDRWLDLRDYLCVLARQGLDPKLREKVDESDLAQDVLLEVVRSKDQFRGESEGELLAYARQIMCRKLIDLRRKYGRGMRDLAREKTEVHSVVDSSCARLADFLRDPATSPSEQAARGEEAIRAASLLQQLPRDQRDAIELHYLMGCSFSEVAQRLGLSRDQAAGLIRRGVHKLRSKMASLE